ATWPFWAAAPGPLCVVAGPDGAWVPVQVHLGVRGCCCRTCGCGGPRPAPPAAVASAPISAATRQPERDEGRQPEQRNASLAIGYGHKIGLPCSNPGHRRRLRIVMQPRHEGSKSTANSYSSLDWLHLFCMRFDLITIFPEF